MSRSLVVLAHSSGGARRGRTQAEKSFPDTAMVIPGFPLEPEDCPLKIRQKNHLGVSSPPGDFDQVPREPSQHLEYSAPAILSLQLQAGE
jgi:hypothetical protein